MHVTIRFHHRVLVGSAPAVMPFGISGIVIALSFFLLFVEQNEAKVVLLQIFNQGMRHAERPGVAA